MHSFTASVIGRNWLRSCGQGDPRQDSKETCFSAWLWNSQRLSGKFSRRSRLLRSQLKAGAAKHRPALSRLEGNRRLGTALRAVGTGLGTHPRASTDALRLALFAMLRLVLELFVVEKQLLARSKHKICAAVAALQYPIAEFHGRL